MIDAVESLARLLHTAAYCAYTETLCAGPMELHDAYNWFKQPPSAGDVVFEISTSYRPDKHWHSVGKLVKVTREPMPGDWGDEEAPTERVWYVEDFNGRVMRWVNCEWLRVPTTPRPWSKT